VRRVVVRLHQPTRDGETEIAILTNLPETVADGFKVAELYRKRWTVETFFQVLTTSLNCEIKTLGYPRAALFSFSMALFAYNALSTLRAALRSVHGTGKIEAGLSNYYLAEEITMTYRGMMIAISPQHWEIFPSMSQEQFCQTLQELAGGLYRNGKKTVKAIVNPG
jgi:CO dehydrogenase/acetyl-CoA synthase gamma subunit (corrinoid Fe-S protein)